MPCELGKTSGRILLECSQPCQRICCSPLSKTCGHPQGPTRMPGSSTRCSKTRYRVPHRSSFRKPGGEEGPDVPPARQPCAYRSAISGAPEHVEILSHAARGFNVGRRIYSHDDKPRAFSIQYSRRKLLLIAADGTAHDRVHAQRCNAFPGDSRAGPSKVAG